MSTELANATFERSCENSDVENETDTNASFPRQNLAGGCGVFANFFEEMAESQSYSASTNPQVLASLQATPDVVKLMDMVGLHEQQEPSTSEDNNPMHAYYNENSNDDLKLMQQYQLFVAGCNQSLPYSENECQLDYSTMTDLLVPVDRCVTTFTPPDLSNQLCVPYMHRNKIPKILANRFLLGETIGRGSYGKVKDAIDLITLRRHAVKIINKFAIRKIPGGWNQALLEAALMRRLSACRYVVSLIVVLRLESPDRLCLVMEHCLGSVHDLQAAGVPSLTNEEDMDDYSANNPLNDSVVYAKDVKVSKNQNSSIPKRSRNFRDCFPSLVMEMNQERKLSVSNVKTRKISNIEAGPTNHMKKNLKSHHQTTQQQQQFRRLSEAQAHAYFLQLIDGLHFLHRNGVIHRDIKPANLLLTPAPGCGLSELGNPDGTIDLPDHNWLSSYEGRSAYIFRSLANLLSASRGWLVKLTDFGVSATISPFSPNNLVGGGQTTPAVQPPEVAKGIQSIFDGTKLDIYSAGVTLYFMLTGRVPFSCQNVLQIFEAIARGEYTIPGHVSSDAADLIRRMMHKDPKKRLTLAQIRQHSWVVHDPKPPMPISQIKSLLKEKLATSPQTKVLNCGIICWLDPLLYLKRPIRGYSPPHIDDTGARIFSLQEISGGSIPLHEKDNQIIDSDDKFHEEQLVKFPIEHSMELHKSLFRYSQPSEAEQTGNALGGVAPFSVINRLEAYYNWPDSGVNPSEHLISNFCLSPDETALRSQIKNFVERDNYAFPSQQLSDLSTDSWKNNRRLRYYSGDPIKQYRNKFTQPSPSLAANISYVRHRGLTVNLPNDYNNMEPPVCPADLPVAQSGSLRPTSGLIYQENLIRAATSLPNPISPGLPHHDSIQFNLASTAMSRSFESTERVPDYSSDFDIAVEGRSTLGNIANITHAHPSNRSIVKHKLPSFFSPHKIRLSRWFSNSFTSLKNRLRNLKTKDSPDRNLTRHNKSTESEPVLNKYATSACDSSEPSNISHSYSNSSQLRKSRRSIFTCRQKKPT